MNNNKYKYTNFFTQQLINAPNGKAILVNRKVKNKNFSYYLNVNTLFRAVRSNRIPNKNRFMDLLKAKGTAKTVFYNPTNFGYLTTSNINNIYKLALAYPTSIIYPRLYANYVLYNRRNGTGQPIKLGNVTLVNLTANQKAKLKKLKNNEARNNRVYKRTSQKKK